MLKNKNFKYLFLGRLATNMGDSIYYLTLSWYILKETNNIFWVGVVQAVIFLPTLFSFIFGGVIDRYPKKTILILLALGQGIFTFFIWLHMLLGSIDPIFLCFLVFGAALFGMNIYTVQDAFIPKLVAKKELALANSYMSTSARTVDYLFNGAVGFLLDIVKAANLLFVSLFSFGLTVFSFQKITFVEAIEPVPKKEKESWFFGFQKIYHDRTLRTMTISLIFINFLFSGLSIYIVLIADQQNSGFVLGLINSGLSIGGIIGSTFVANKILKGIDAGQKLIITSLLFGVMLLFASWFALHWSIIIWFAAAAMFLGASQILYTPLLQTIVEQKHLGKILSAQSSATVGIMPLGFIIFGEVAKMLPINYFLIIFGLSYIALGIIYYYDPVIRTFCLVDSSETELGKNASIDHISP